MKHDCDIENAPKFAEWIRSRGGVAVWKSADLGDPGKTWSAPYLETDGKTAKPKQSWQMQDTPAMVVTDPEEIEVYAPQEVKRFHVAIRQSGNGLTLVVTDGGTRGIRKEVEAAGNGAFYSFDYGDEQNCVIYTSKSVGTLKKWMDENTEPAKELV